MDQVSVLAPPNMRAGATEQAVCFRRDLEKYTWAELLMQRGPTTTHIPLLHYIWNIGYGASGRPSTVSAGGHRLRFLVKDGRVSLTIDGQNVVFRQADIERALLTEDDLAI